VTRVRLALLGLALLVLLVMALASFPARLAASWLDREQIAVSAVQGTIWEGRAGRVVMRTPAGSLHLGELRWKLHPWSLLALAPSATIESQWGSQHLVTRLWRRGGRWELRDFDAMVDARLLRHLVPVVLRGNLSVQLERLSLTSSELLHAQGRVVWQNALWQTDNGSVPLGNYVALLDSEGEGSIAAKISTLSGPLRAEGEVRIDGHRYHVETQIAAPGGMDGQLAQALSLIAEPRENGYLLRLDGELRPAP